MTDKRLEELYSQIAALKAQLVEEYDRRKRAEAEVSELLDEAFRAEAYPVQDVSNPMFDWWDTEARSHVRDWGDRLVELGLWERHPDGYGRRWFYRPLNKEKP